MVIGWFCHSPLAKDSVHVQDYTSSALPYFLGSPEQVLVLNAGTGRAGSLCLTKEQSAW